MKSFASNNAPSAEWTSQICAQLGAQLPTTPISGPYSPQLVYARHNGPPRHDARLASVLIHMFPHEGVWSFPLVRRADVGDVHSGQIALPGGMIEPQETAADAARREFEEETGVAIAPQQIAGELSPVYIYVSNFWVRCFVSVGPEITAWSPCDREVAELIFLPIADLWNEQIRSTIQVNRRGLQLAGPALEIGGSLLWGATYHILMNFVQALQSGQD
ncbi:CoA pyrophosphatase [Blastopirellula sp. JC732]|uniref:CoA pyrophosphatase n=1 Tax=Blastopirellula sediminis TaxID=2894196 RepID=A0A9X1SF76_9BACT|nr:CoA pyrophosphatase [Blastopirellula sediminis]MCC9609235.1 CoA pyrophosphatase [Blastopirellula sediminis]MCC9627988.1 CoA pyrophosphatase [Blastopirellula sediminis]